MWTWRNDSLIIHVRFDLRSIWYCICLAWRYLLKTYGDFLHYRRARAAQFYYNNRVRRNDSKIRATDGIDKVIGIAWLVIVSGLQSIQLVRTSTKAKVGKKKLTAIHYRPNKTDKCHWNLPRRIVRLSRCSSERAYRWIGRTTTAGV